MVCSRSASVSSVLVQAIQHHHHHRTVICARLPTAASHLSPRRFSGNVLDVVSLIENNHL